MWPYWGCTPPVRLVEHGYQYANNVAAVPSLHAAFSLLIAITLWPRKHKWLRPIVALYPLAMAFSLVYAGEHYFSDILLGWIYTVGHRVRRSCGDKVVGRAQSPARARGAARTSPAPAYARTQRSAGPARPW